MGASVERARTWEGNSGLCQAASFTHVATAILHVSQPSQVPVFVMSTHLSRRNRLYSGDTKVTAGSRKWRTRLQNREVATLVTAEADTVYQRLGLMVPDPRVRAALCNIPTGGTSERGCTGSHGLRYLRRAHFP